MPSLTTAIVVLLAGLLGEWVPLTGHFPGYLPFWLFSAAPSLVAFLLGFVSGRFFLSRLDRPKFDRAVPIVVFFIQVLVLAAHLFFLSEQTDSAPLFPLGWFLGVLPGWAGFLGASLGSFRISGRRRGFTLLEWIGPRLFLIPQLPFLCLPFLQLFFQEVVPGRAAFERYPALYLAVFGGTLLLLLSIGPFLVKMLFPTEPLPASLLERFQLLASRENVYFHRAYVWNTGARSILNACVAGIFGFSRFIFVTDALLRTLDQEELEAVFAHELSHVRCRHFPILVGFLCGFAALLLGGTGFLEDEVPPFLLLSLATGSVGAFLVGPFARVSRVLELEADLEALRMGAQPESLIQALRKLQSFSSRPRKGHSWRHFSIPYRISAIMAWQLEPSFRKSFKIRKAVALLGVAFCVVAGAVTLAALFLTGKEKAHNYKVSPQVLAQMERKLAKRCEKLLFEMLEEGKWSVLESPEFVSEIDRAVKLSFYKRSLLGALRLQRLILCKAEVPPSLRDSLKRGYALVKGDGIAAVCFLEALASKLQEERLDTFSSEELLLQRDRNMVVDRVLSRALVYLLLAKAYEKVGYGSKAARARKKLREIIGLPSETGWKG